MSKHGTSSQYWLGINILLRPSKIISLFTNSFSWNGWKGVQLKYFVIPINKSKVFFLWNTYQKKILFHVSTPHILSTNHPKKWQYKMQIFILWKLQWFLFYTNHITEDIQKTTKNEKRKLKFNFENLFMFFSSSEHAFTSSQTKQLNNADKILENENIYKFSRP